MKSKVKICIKIKTNVNYSQIKMRHIKQDRLKKYL